MQPVTYTLYAHIAVKELGYATTMNDNDAIASSAKNI